MQTNDNNSNDTEKVCEVKQVEMAASNNGKSRDKISSMIKAVTLPVKINDALQTPRLESLPWPCLPIKIGGVEDWIYHT